MANLIIGHTTEKSARIWIRGGNHSCVAKISIHTGENKEKTQSHSIDLVPDNDYTAVVSFEGLTADTHYTVRVCFASTRGGLGTSGATFQVQGGFRTFPDLQQGQPRPFSFLLGSCNLSIFTINSFLALLLGLVGRTAMTRSLKRPIDKWDMDFPKGRWWTFFLKRFPGTFRCLSKIGITYGVGFVAMATKGKQPGKPMLKSPFLKLCSLFHLWKIDFDSGKNEPLIGRTITGHDSRATGVLTFSPILETGSWKSGNNGPGDAKGGFYLTHVRGKFQAGEDLKVEDKIIARSTSQAEEVVEKWSIGFQCGEKEPSVSDIITGSESGAAGVLADPANKHSGSWLDKTAAGSLTLIQLEGTFRRGEVMKVKEKVIGKSKSLAVKFPFDYQKPAFVLHAGDQIYFDFPYRERRPELEAYRRT
ncbi:MAG: hypothetical protein KC592_11790, partial [Nitrospira sp.]|nr:hypothetical protein [Nitrospira sp.]